MATYYSDLVQAGSKFQPAFFTSNTDGYSSDLIRIAGGFFSSQSSSSTTTFEGWQRRRRFVLPNEQQILATWHDEEEILEMILAFLTIQAHRRTGTDPVSHLLLSGVGAGPEVTTEKT